MLARILLPIALGSAVVAVAFAADTARGSATLQPARGVAVIETDLAYQDGSAAGTGMVIDPSGIVLTNNHVIRGATSVRVRLGSRTYPASVLGYAIGDDVAVLRLQGASGLATVTLGDSSSVRRGQAVTAVGNARGAGRIVTARGSVTGLARSITVQDDQGGTARLVGLIETDAALEPGDSGGPLLDARGRVVGMDAAASTGFAFRSVASDGYAIPINRAIAIAKQIRAGRSSATVHVGGTGFLGVSLDSRQGGAVIADVVSGGPAEAAGLGPGDTITQLDGRSVSSYTSLLPILDRRRPGDTVTIRWIDQFGQQHAGSARLASGPPQ